MNKEELKFLMGKGFTISELLEIEGGGIPKQPEAAASPEPQPAPETPPAPDPEPAAEPDNKPDPSAAKIAALEAQVEQLQAQLLRLGTYQPGGKEEKIEDLVAAF